jgi:uncharacterized membrane protein YozB (DUF420 family)
MSRTSIVAAICVLQWSAFLLKMLLPRGIYSIGALDVNSVIFAIQALIAFGGFMRLATLSPREERRKIVTLTTLRVVITQFVLTTLLVGVINIDKSSEKTLYCFMLLSGLLGGTASFIMTSLQARKTTDPHEIPTER